MREKRARKRSSSAVEFSKHEPTQNLDAADAEQDPEIPTSFLSASVREYLELGRSIPGDCQQRRNFYRVELNKKKNTDPQSIHKWYNLQRSVAAITRTRLNVFEMYYHCLVVLTALCPLQSSSVIIPIRLMHWYVGHMNEMCAPETATAINSKIHADTHTHTHHHVCGGNRRQTTHLMHHICHRLIGNTT